MIPSLFICHGAPTLAIDDNIYTRFLQDLGRRVTPQAIVLFTAHWESEITTISFKDDVYDTIYDFGGFSKELFEIKYKAKGSTQIASLVEEKLNSNGIPTKRDEKRGLDHGAWVILNLMYPKADIPVIQVSINPYLLPKDQHKIGKALKDLRNENVLIIGSGGTSHNLGMIKWGQSTPEDWTVEFDDWLIENIENQNFESLFRYDTLAPYAQLAVPRAEHFVPLFIALGGGNDNKQPKVLHRSYQFGTLSHIVFEF